MAICEYCKQEMLDADDCPWSGANPVEYPDGVRLPALPFTGFLPGWPREKPEENERCHDCGILAGNYHHPGCDMEVCPRCGGQLISCGCLDEEDDE